MKKFELNITIHEDDGKIKAFHRIMHDDLVGLTSQFVQLIVSVQRELHEEELEEMRMKNDDIPF